MEVPRILLRRKYLMESILFVALFSVIFMTLYRPFSDTAWFGFVPQQRLFVTLCFYLVAVAAMILSKQLMAHIFLARALTMRTYLVWLTGESVLIALIYAGFTVIFGLRGDSFDWALVGRIVLCVVLILAIPNAILILYGAYRVQTEELNLMRKRLATRQVEPEPESRTLHFVDNNDIQRVSFEEEDIFYIESQDNYVRIYYALEGRLVSYMLRCRTQKVEEALQATSLVRCHRSYLVNTRKISHYKMEHDRAKITLSHENAKQIPVSKSYYRQITDLLSATEPQLFSKSL